LRLGRLRDGVSQGEIRWFEIVFKCALILFHSQASFEYQSTFTLGGTEDEPPESLWTNRRIFYTDHLLTSFMIIIRMSYFMPKLVFRLYCLLREENTEITKSKNRHILCEQNGLLDSSPFSKLFAF
jgi:hypothetical protein